MPAFFSPGSVPSLAAGLFFGGLAGLGAYQLSQDPRNVWVFLGRFASGAASVFCLPLRLWWACVAGSLLCFSAASAKQRVGFITENPGLFLFCILNTGRFHATWV
jgi:hypothetical protein